MRKIGTLKVKSSQEIAHSRVGVGFECLDRDLFTPEKCYDLAAKSGAKYVRVQTGWARCETVKGKYDFAWLDDIVDNLLKRNMIPWFNVGYGNPIYMPDAPNSTAVGCVPLLYGEAVTDAWLAYTEALAQHFEGRITHFEIWNEPDISHFWYPGKPNALQLAQLIKLTGNVIRQKIPTAKIGTCTSNSSLDYLHLLFAGLNKEEIDFYCLHNYDRFPEHSPRMARLEIIKELLKAHDLQHVELWMGEGGHASWHPVGHGQCKEGGGSERRQAVWHLRRFFLDLEADLKLTSLFMIVDLWEKPYEKAKEVLSKPAAHGILNGITYTPKKSYETLGYASAVLSGNCKVVPRFADVLPKNDTPIRCICFSVNGKNVLAYWQETPIEEERVEPEQCTRVVFSPLKRFTDPVLVDMFTGEVFEIREGEELGEDPYKDLVIGEYPRLLCERDTFEIVSSR